MPFAKRGDFARPYLVASTEFGGCWHTAMQRPGEETVKNVSPAVEASTLFYMEPWGYGVWLPEETARKRIGLLS